MENKNVTLGAKTNNSTQDLPEQFIDREFQVPTDVVKLPSLGKFYANGQDTVEIKYLTAEDENILTSMDLIKSGKVLDILLENSIVRSEMPVSQLLTCDRNAILLALRSTGYGDEYEVKTTCKSCGEEFLSIIKLSELKVKDVISEQDSNGEFGVQLPKMKLNIKFRLLTGEDESRLAKSTEKGKKKIGKQISIPQLLTERYLLQIMEVEGTRDKLYIQRMIKAMPISDSLFLREYIRLIEPGIDMKWDYECVHCGHIEGDDVPITLKLFWPNANV